MWPVDGDRRDRDDQRQLRWPRRRRAPRGRGAEHAAVEQQRRGPADDQEEADEQRHLQQRAGSPSASRSKFIPLVTKKNGIRKPKPTAVSFDSRTSTSRPRARAA